MKSALDPTVSTVKSGAVWTEDKVNDATDYQIDPIPLPKVKSAASRVGEFVSESYHSLKSNPEVQEVSEGTKKTLDEMDQKFGHEPSRLYSRISGGGTVEYPNTPPQYR
jgi:hypothetical protein